MAYRLPGSAVPSWRLLPGGRLRGYGCEAQSSNEATNLGSAWIASAMNWRLSTLPSGASAAFRTRIRGSPISRIAAETSAKKRAYSAGLAAPPHISCRFGSFPTCTYSVRPSLRGRPATNAAYPRASPRYPPSGPSGVGASQPT